MAKDLQYAYKGKTHPFEALATCSGKRQVGRKALAHALSVSSPEIMQIPLDDPPELGEAQVA